MPKKGQINWKKIKKILEIRKKIINKDKYFYTLFRSDF